MSLNSIRVRIRETKQYVVAIGFLSIISFQDLLASTIQAVSTQTETTCKKRCKPRFQGFTTFVPRSQGDNTARQLSGWQQHLFLPYENNYAVISSTIEYTRSFDTEYLATRLVSSPRITFSGSQHLVECEPGQSKTSSRNPNDIVADYFGLPTEFTGTLSVQPRIENTIIDVHLYCGLQDALPGLFLWINAPVVHTQWNLGLDECIVCEPKVRGCTRFPDGYMYSGNTTPNTNEDCPTPLGENSQRVPRDYSVNSYDIVPSAQRNAQGTTQNLREALSGTFTFGDMVEPWEFGRFSFNSRSKTGLAHIDVLLGWNFIQNDYIHLGIFSVTDIPTGNRPKAHYIFEPLVGDGKHWKLGGGASAHISLFPNTDESRFNMGVYAYGKAMHVFPTDQVRSFDFVRENNEPTKMLTRYMLLKEFNTAGEYNGTMINAINFATRNCEVHVGLLADISAKAFISLCGWEFDLGYNFYFREREKITIKTASHCPIDSRQFGFKGLEGVCCTSFNVVNDIVEVNNPKSNPLSSTDGSATMFNPQLPELAPTKQPNDPPQSTCLSWNSELPIKDTHFDTVSLQECFVGITTEKPQFISCVNLNPRSAAQGEMRTNKLFGNISYTFDSCYSPFVGVGAEGEFDGSNNNGLQQWGIWIKAGASF